MSSNGFLERFKGKVSSIPKRGMQEVIKNAENPVEKEGWRSYLNSITEKENQKSQKKLEKEIREIDKIQRRILPKLKYSKVMKQYPKRSHKDKKKLETIVEREVKMKLGNDFFTPRMKFLKKSHSYNNVLNSLSNIKLSMNNKNGKNRTRKNSVIRISQFDVSKSENFSAMKNRFLTPHTRRKKFGMNSIAFGSISNHYKTKPGYNERSQSYSRKTFDQRGVKTRTLSNQRQHVRTESNVNGYSGLPSLPKHKNVFM